MRHLSLEPQNIDSGTWYYEERGGLHVVRYHADTGSGPEQFRLPWRKIIASVKRYEASKRRKPRHAK